MSFIDICNDWAQAQLKSVGVEHNMDTTALENPPRELKQQGSLRDLSGDSMGRTPACISALGWPQRCFWPSASYRTEVWVDCQQHVLLVAIFLTEKLIIPKFFSFLSYCKNIILRIQFF